MNVKGERVLIFGDSLSHHGPDAASPIWDVDAGSSRTSGAPGDLLASMLLEQGASAARVNARVGRSAFNFFGREASQELLSSDAQFRPTKVFVILGTNDVGLNLDKDAEAMEAIKRFYEGLGAEVWAIGPLTYVSDTFNKQAIPVVHMMERVFGPRFIDGRSLSVQVGRAGDGIHFGATAARQTAANMLQAIMLRAEAGASKFWLVLMGAAAVFGGAWIYAWMSKRKPSTFLTGDLMPGRSLGTLTWKKAGKGVYHADTPHGRYTIDGNNAGRNRWTVTYPDGDYGMADALSEAKIWAQEHEASKAGRSLGAGRKPFKIAATDPATMTAQQINKELDKLDMQDSTLGDEMIAAGRGHERPSEYLKMEDPLSRELLANYERRSALRNEIALRFGPGAPSRFPVGDPRYRGYFKPRKSKDESLDGLGYTPPEERFKEMLTEAEDMADISVAQDYALEHGLKLSEITFEGENTSELGKKFNTRHGAFHLNRGKEEPRKVEWIVEPQGGGYRDNKKPRAFQAMIAVYWPTSRNSMDPRKTTTELAFFQNVGTFGSLKEAEKYATGTAWNIASRLRLLPASAPEMAAVDRTKRVLFDRDYNQTPEPQELFGLHVVNGKRWNGSEAELVRSGAHQVPCKSGIKSITCWQGGKGLRDSTPPEDQIRELILDEDPNSMLVAEDLAMQHGIKLSKWSAGPSANGGSFRLSPRIDKNGRGTVVHWKVKPMGIGRCEALFQVAVNDWTVHPDLKKDRAYNATPGQRTKEDWTAWHTSYYGAGDYCQRQATADAWAIAKALKEHGPFPTYSFVEWVKGTSKDDPVANAQAYEAKDAIVGPAREVVRKALDQDNSQPEELFGVALDHEMARKSLHEERQAIDVYGKRIKKAVSPKLKKALKHARKEEREHAAMFKPLAGYRVAYDIKGERNVVEGSYQTLEAAQKLRNAYNRRGLWAWIEDDDGNFVPVKGAKREHPAYKRWRDQR